MSTATITPSLQAVRVVRLAGVLTVVAALVGAIGGLVLAFIPPAPGAVEGTFAYPLDATGHAFAQSVFALNHVLLAFGLVAVTLSPEAAKRPGRLGGWIAVAGMLALTVAEIWAITLAAAPWPSDATAGIDTLYGLSSITLGIGLVLLGVGILRSRDPGLGGWQRWITLVLGAMVFLVVTPGLMLGFVAGRLALVVWMVAWAVFGLAIVRRAGRRPVVE
ncbi:hypothetical protein [Agromyces sp. LHK192]|uniref:hypothetical protein n=1 Tax=Agromyces sp. LHK192 TaxID=2498704 RepID=UPI000FD760F0|nr:hypothetical protein [Agromyces sp. LHK192]